MAAAEHGDQGRNGCAAARCFFSKTLDALGVRADASYGELEPALLEALVVGRPIAEPARVS